MIAPLRNPTYRRLFLAQVISLVGTGLATVALGLLAFELAGSEAGLVLGTALAIKMVAYIGVAPVAGAIAITLPRRAVLVALDAIRAGIVLLLPFVDQLWQVYVLIFVLQSASAAVTPAFQATIPDILRDEREYTEALSLSRLAYDLESLLSPMLAALLLTLITFHWLFAGTAIGFVISGLIVLSLSLPPAIRNVGDDTIFARMTSGLRIYLATPRLRGLLALNLAAAAAGAMVIVNTVVIVRSALGGTDVAVATALGVFGAGSMVAALALPRLLDRFADRTVMIVAAGTLAATLLVLGSVFLISGPNWLLVLASWLLIGLCYSAVLTPSGRLLRRSAHEADRPAVFAAQFALSHACWLITYTVAGWIGAEAGLGPASLLLAGLAAIGVASGLYFWPSIDPEIVDHIHHDLPSDHPHIAGAEALARGHRHSHKLVIDRHHSRWPSHHPEIT